MKPCQLKSLTDQNSNSPFMGLTQNELRIEVKPSYFSCCNGEGVCLTSTGEVQICKLNSHLQRLRTILNLFLARWGTEHRGFMRGMVTSGDLKRLSAEKTQGRVIVSQGRSTPSYLWLIAITAAWRLGLDVHFVSLMLGDSKENLLPRHPCSVVCVENLRSPWHPENAFDCEAVISYCYNTNTPLWFDFMSGETDTGEEGDAVIRRIQQRLKKSRGTNPLLHLTTSSQNKLREMIE